jgi:hypothetical protein
LSAALSGAAGRGRGLTLSMVYNIVNTILIVRWLGWVKGYTSLGVYAGPILRAARPVGDGTCVPFLCFVRKNN